LELPKEIIVSQIAAIVLAAGASTRFGQCKQLLDWHGKPLLAHVTDVALGAGLEPVVAVLGCQAEETRGVLADRPVRVMMNWGWEEGMSSSVQVGLAALPPEVEAAIFLQCDQPLVSSGLLKALGDRFRETAASIVHPMYEDRRGTPVLFARRFFPELAAINGDEGGRRLISRYPDAIATVEVDAPAVLADIDTPDDYESLSEGRVSQPASFDRSSATLHTIRHLLIDMDGVLWRGDEPMPHLQQFFAFLRQRAIDFMLVTNNSSKTPQQYVDKLARMDVDIAPGQVLTSALASAAYLADVAPVGARVYAIGGEGLRQALQEQGFVLAEEGADYVVVGWDRDLTWDKLATAALLIHEGAAFIGTNPDVSYPTERGPVPGNGAQLAALEVATGVTPVVAGKPERQLYEEALRRLNASSETTAMVGDRLDTDMAGAERAGLSTVLVLSGIAGEGDLESSAVQPDVVCADIGELIERWKQALLGS
jgi:4-nitrophenyl phosphatase